MSSDKPTAPSETPRTDAFYAELYRNVPADMVELSAGKERDFARQLERELADKEWLLKEMLDQLRHDQAQLQSLKSASSSTGEVMTPVTVEVSRSEDGRVFANVFQGVEQLAHLKAGQSYTIAAQAEVEAAKRIAGFYFEIAEDVVGADEVRRRFQERFGRELERCAPSETAPTYEPVGVVNSEGGVTWEKLPGDLNIGAFVYVRR